MQKIEIFLQSLLRHEKVEFHRLGRRQPWTRQALNENELAVVIKYLTLHIRAYKARNPFASYGLKRKKVERGQGHPTTNSRRDGFLMACHQVLRHPSPPRGRERLKTSEPILPPDCYGFIHPIPLLKNILLHISPKEIFPKNFPGMRDRFIKKVQRKGLYATASIYLDDTRKNRLLNPKEKSVRPSPPKPDDSASRASLNSGPNDAWEVLGYRKRFGPSDIPKKRAG